MNSGKDSVLGTIVAALPIPTIAVSENGQVLAASQLFAELARAKSPLESLAQIGDAKLHEVLARATRQPTSDEELVYQGTGQTFRLSYRQAEGGASVICLIPENVEVATTSSEASTVTSSGAVGRELPGPEQTLDLLGRAITACQSAEASLAVVRLQAKVAEGGKPLWETDQELWRHMGRRLRATCRVSDLVGVTETGDFLIILLGASEQDAKMVTNRVLGQLHKWLRSDVNTEMAFSTGFATWTPGEPAVVAAALARQTAEKLHAETEL